MLTVAFPSSPTQLSDREGALLGARAPACQAGRRPRSGDRRLLLDGLFYVLRRGGQWRLLPRAYGPWSTVYASFRMWRRAGVWERIPTTLRGRVRPAAGRHPTPSAAINDTHSVTTTARGGPHGSDGAKKLSRRQRHRLVDTLLGVGHGVRVPPADRQDRAGACQLLPALTAFLPRREVIWAVTADGGPLPTGVYDSLGGRAPIARAAWRTGAVAAGGPGASHPAPRRPASPKTLGGGENPTTLPTIRS
jgi:transposase